MIFNLARNKKVFLILLFLFASFGTTQKCIDELKAGLSDEMLLETSTTRAAAKLLKKTVELLEPAMPPLADAHVTALSLDDPDYPTIKFLADRQILPDTWQDGELNAPLWRAMLLNIVQWYEILPIRISSEALTNQQLIDHLSTLINRASVTIHPLVLAGVDQNDISFVGIIKNDPPYPRLIVIKPPEGIDISSNFQNIFSYIGNCASNFVNYVHGPSIAARQLFLTHNSSSMYVFKTDPTKFESWIEVPQGEEVPYLEFTNPNVADLGNYTALFSGSGPGIFTLMQIVPQFRTNMSPREIINFIQAIPR